MKKLFSQFGAKVTDDLAARYDKSPNWDGTKFNNLVTTTMDIDLQSLPKLLHEQFCKREGREPQRKLDVAPLNWEDFSKKNDRAQYIWYGHSALLLNIGGKIIFIDPMMGSNASPIAPWKTSRFTGSLLHILEQIPHIDIVLMSHDHYDHLDLDSIKIIHSKTGRWITALGVARHLEKWGVASESIIELDWWQNILIEELQFTFTPTRHFSGRGARDRAKSLWGGWVLRTSTEKIYFSGDSGYGDHFKEVGEKLGPFDLGFMECGQYNENWKQIHMTPEESVVAALDAGVNKALPVHWAGFALAMHTWTDPVIRFRKAAQKAGLAVVTPEIGSAFHSGYDLEISWWDS
jgi:L-ascorbate metabolism protein UlaG (beta-lactamase superfamily)